MVRIVHILSREILFYSGYTALPFIDLRVNHISGTTRHCCHTYLLLQFSHILHVSMPITHLQWCGNYVDSLASTVDMSIKKLSYVLYYTIIWVCMCHARKFKNHNCCYCFTCCWDQMHPLPYCLPSEVSPWMWFCCHPIYVLFVTWQIPIVMAPNLPLCSAGYSYLSSVRARTTPEAVWREWY